MAGDDRSRNPFERPGTDASPEPTLGGWLGAVFAALVLLFLGEAIRRLLVLFIIRTEPTDHTASLTALTYATTAFGPLGGAMLAQAIGLRNAVIAGSVAAVGGTAGVLASGALGSAGFVLTAAGLSATLAPLYVIVGGIVGANPEARDGIFTATLVVTHAATFFTQVVVFAFSISAEPAFLSYAAFGLALISVPIAVLLFDDDRKHPVARKAAPRALPVRLLIYATLIGGLGAIWNAGLLPLNAGEHSTNLWLNFHRALTLPFAIGVTIVALARSRGTRREASRLKIGAGGVIAGAALILGLAAIAHDAPPMFLVGISALDELAQVIVFPVAIGVAASLSNVRHALAATALMLLAGAVIGSVMTALGTLEALAGAALVAGAALATVLGLDLLLREG
jgi:hypothetical protein